MAARTDGGFDAARIAKNGDLIDLHFPRKKGGLIALTLSDENMEVWSASTGQGEPQAVRFVMAVVRAAMIAASRGPAPWFAMANGSGSNPG